MKHTIEDQLQRTRRVNVEMSQDRRQAVFSRLMNDAQLEISEQKKTGFHWNWFTQRPVQFALVTTCSVLLVISISVFSYSKNQQMARQNVDQQLVNQVAESEEGKQVPVNVAIERKREPGYASYLNGLFGSGGPFSMDTREWKFSDFTPTANDARRLPVFQLREFSAEELRERAQVFSVSGIEPVQSDIVSDVIFSNFTPSLNFVPRAFDVSSTESQDPFNCTVYTVQAKDRCLVLSPKGFVYFAQKITTEELDGEAQAKRLIAAVYNTTADDITVKASAGRSENIPAEAKEILLYPPDYTLAGVRNKPQPWSALLIEGKLVTLVGFVAQPDIERPVEQVDVLSAQDAYAQFLTEWTKGAFNFEMPPRTFIFENPFTQLNTLPQEPLQLNGADFVLQYEVLRQDNSAEDLHIWLKPVYRFIGDVEGESFDFDIIINSTDRKEFLRGARYFYNGN